MKKTLFLFAVLTLFVIPTAALANTITFTTPTTAANNTPIGPGSNSNPNSSNYQGGSNQFDLDHHRAYTWQLSNVLIPPGQVVTGASITFRNISNWDTNPNMLFVHLLDSARTVATAGDYDGQARSATVNGVTWYTDAAGSPVATIADYFAGNDLALVNSGTADTLLFQQAFNMVGQNNYNSATDFTYNLTSAQLQVLVQYLANGNNLALGFDPDCHFWNNGLVFTVTTGPAVPEPTTMLLLGTGIAGVYLRKRRRN